jgi:hypothetical protein
MDRKIVATILTLLLAGCAGYLTGGLHTSVVYVLLAGAWVCWKYA